MGSGTRLARAILLGCAVSALAAPAAYASQTWYTTPHPNAGATCAKTNPCGLAFALSVVSNGDQVVVGQGDYGSQSHPIIGGFVTSASIYIHGASGQPRPRLFVSEMPDVGGPALALSGAGSVVSDLAIDDLAPSDIGLEFAGTVADRVLVRAKDTGCELEGETGGPGSPLLRDSVCEGGQTAVSVDNFANSAFTPTIRNVTAVGGRNAMVVTAGEDHATGSIDVEADNVIADGALYAGSLTSASASISFAFSDYNPANIYAGSTVINDGENISAPPVFVDSATGDYHEAAASPTIDRGVDAPANGPVDLDGNVRAMGPSTDMGAYEHVVRPTARTGTVSRLEAHSVTLHGSILNGASVGADWAFEWGTSCSATHETTERLVGPSASFQQVSAVLTGLAPNTTYCYHIFALNPAGNSIGANRTFKTPQ